MAKFTFISFNIRKQQKLLEEIVNYVSKKGNKRNIIFAIQEMPGESKVNKLNVPHNVSLQKRAGLGFVFSKHINACMNKLKVSGDDISGTRKNAMLLTVPLDFESLHIVNIHATAKKDGDDDPKKTNRILFQNIEYILGGNSKRIYMGDFNTNPYEENLVSDEVLYTSREMEEVRNGLTKISFYNPGWRYLREKKGICSTYCDQKFFPRWQLLDHILISKILCQKTIYSYNILNGFSNKKFEISEFLKNAKKDGFSDHLPVSLTMEI